MTLPDRAEGHWTTDEGRAMAARYVGKPRAALPYGDRSDFDLANAQFLATRRDLDLPAFQQGAKDRIRWLSVQLALAEARAARLCAAGDAMASAIEDAETSHIYDLDNGDQQPEDCRYRGARIAWAEAKA